MLSSKLNIFTMIFCRFPLIFGTLLMVCSCSSVGIYDLQKQGARVTRGPSRILVEPFSAPLNRFALGERSSGEKNVLRNEIVTSLARSTAAQLRIHAADAAVVGGSNVARPGTWLVRGEIREVDQGSRALRAGVGLGMGRTTFRTRVTVFDVTSTGLVPLLRFSTTGSSGLEPGAALGVATAGVGTGLAVANAAGSAVLAGLPGVNTDIDRTSYEIAAVVSVYLQRNGLLGASRTPISPNIAGQMPSTLNLNRAVPAPMRDNQ